MKQFFTVFKWELGGYLKNRAYVGLTVALVALLAIVLFFPQIIGFFASDDDSDADDADSSESEVMLVNADCLDSGDTIIDALALALPDIEIKSTDDDYDFLEQKVLDGDCDYAVLFKGSDEYEYIVNKLGLYDQNTDIISEVLKSSNISYALAKLGASEQEISELMSAEIKSDIMTVGKDQTSSFFYTYILIFALYMAVLLYGQFVSMSVAGEKSSRAMELLVTSASPKSLMFGKILGVGSAGILQLVVLFGSAFLMYNINKDAWSDNEIINSIFNIPLSVLGFMILFFVLGYFLYAFMYGAAGSLVSKTEDLNTAATPITFLFIIAFCFAMTGLGSGDVDSPLMIALSYIPFTSPMSMFVRITMGDTAAWEIILSVAILLASAVGIGFVSAKIYKLGILLYGKPLKLTHAVKQAFSKN